MIGRLIIAMTCLLAGLFSLVKANDNPPLQQVVGAVYVASNNDCSMLLNLTDVTGSCYYTLIDSSGVVSALKRYGKLFGLVVGEEVKLYDAKAVMVGNVLVIIRKSDNVNAYVVLIGDNNGNSNASN